MGKKGCRRRISSRWISLRIRSCQNQTNPAIWDDRGPTPRNNHDFESHESCCRRGQYRGRNQNLMEFLLRIHFILLPREFNLKTVYMQNIWTCGIMPFTCWNVFLKDCFIFVRRKIWTLRKWSRASFKALPCWPLLHTMFFPCLSRFGGMHKAEFTLVSAKQLKLILNTYSYVAGTR